jgi:hypothetical protein
MNHIIAKQKRLWVDAEGKGDRRVQNLDIMGMLLPYFKMYDMQACSKSASYLAKRRRRGWAKHMSSLPPVNVEFSDTESEDEDDSDDDMDSDTEGESNDINEIKDSENELDNDIKTKVSKVERNDIIEIEGSDATIDIEFASDVEFKNDNNEVEHEKEAKHDDAIEIQDSEAESENDSNVESEDSETESENDDNVENVHHNDSEIEQDSDVEYDNNVEFYNSETESEDFELKHDDYVGSESSRLRTNAELSSQGESDNSSDEMMQPFESGDELDGFLWEYNLEQAHDAYIPEEEIGIEEEETEEDLQKEEEYEIIDENAEKAMKQLDAEYESILMKSLFMFDYKALDRLPGPYNPKFFTSSARVPQKRKPKTMLENNRPAKK